MNNINHTIIICSNAYPPNFIGGAEIIAHNQAKELKKKGHNVIVLAGDTYSNKRQYEVYTENFEGIDIYRIRLNSENFDNNFINFKNKEVEDVFLKIIDKYNPDVVHCHNIIGLSLGIIDIAKNIGIKTIVTLHDHWGYCYKNTILKSNGKLCDDFSKCYECKKYIMDNGNKIPIKARSDYFKFILDKVDVFISPSKYLADSYIKAGIPKEKMNVIWNGIDINRYINIEKKVSSKLRFTFVGHFGKHKGVITMLEALTYIKDIDKIQINLVGDGEEKNSYINFAKKNNILKNIKFWGKVPNSEINKVYEETDVYFIASIWPENQPVSITEAFICKIPVIASKLGGNIELIEDKKEGIFFEPGNAKDLAKKLEYFIENPELISKYGINAYKKMSEFSFESQVDKIIEKYEEETINTQRDEKLTIAFYGSNMLNIVVKRIYSDLQILKIEWINEWNFKDLDIIIVLDENNVEIEFIKKIMKYKNTLIVPEKNVALKDLMIEYNCGLYYIKQENIYKYLEYLIKNKREREILQCNAYNSIFNLNKLHK